MVTPVCFSKPLAALTLPVLLGWGAIAPVLPAKGQGATSVPSVDRVAQTTSIPVQPPQSRPSARPPARSPAGKPPAGKPPGKPQVRPAPALTQPIQVRPVGAGDTSLPVIGPGPADAEPERPDPDNLPPVGGVRREILVPQEVRPLPGSLDSVPVFSSNNPEVVQNDGILLSTFPKEGKQYPQAHLNYAFNNRFDIFAHHITRARTAAQTRAMFQGILVYNPSDRPVRIEVLQAASYLTRPDALFTDLPSYVEDPLGRVFAGPGSRMVNDVLRGRRQGVWPVFVVLQPKETYLLMNLPIPAGKVVPSSNGRSTLMRLWSNGPVYLANLAMFAPSDGELERAPTLDEWQNLLVNGDWAYPRDGIATPPGQNPERMIYSRVAGVAKGSRWKARLSDRDVNYLRIPREGQAISYGMSTLPRGTLGTGQVQSAPMLARYPDSAYLSHGNYGVEYNLTVPLGNPRRVSQTVALSIQTPIKDNENRNGLRFFEPPEPRIFYRGTVRLRYIDDRNRSQIRYVHIVQRRGEQGQPLVTLNLKSGELRTVQVDLLYPPDATPPQVLTIQTLDQSVAQQVSPVLRD